MQSEVADVLPKVGSKIESYGSHGNFVRFMPLNAEQRSWVVILMGVMTVEHYSYNSCRNRHCPKCQGNKREDGSRLEKQNSYSAIPMVLP
jgi:hypothetical protein